MATIKQRITYLENTGINKEGFRPMPISYFYGESLPADFYTSPVYVKSKVPSIGEFYAESNLDLS